MCSVRAASRSPGTTPAPLLSSCPGPAQVCLSQLLGRVGPPLSLPLSLHSSLSLSPCLFLSVPHSLSPSSISPSLSLSLPFSLFYLSLSLYLSNEFRHRV